MLAEAFIISIFMCFILLIVIIMIYIRCKKNNLLINLPKVDFKGRMPENVSVIVAMHLVMESKKKIREALVNFKKIAENNNQQGIFYFLLADLPENMSKWTMHDAELIDYAKKIIDEMGDTFYILVRSREYFEYGKIWKCKDGKKGAFVELNKKVIKGDVLKASYIVGIDDDYELPKNVVFEMVEIMHHKMNVPKVKYFCAEPVISTGYVIIRPQIIGRICEKEKTNVFENLYNDSSYYGYDNMTLSNKYIVPCRDSAFDGVYIYNPYAYEFFAQKGFDRVFSYVGYAKDICVYKIFPSSYFEMLEKESINIKNDIEIIKKLYKKVSFGNIILNIAKIIFWPSMFSLFMLGGLLFNDIFLLWLVFMLSIILLKEKGKLKNVLLRLILDFTFLPYRAFLNSKAIIKGIMHRESNCRKNILNFTTFDCFCSEMWFNYAAAIFFFYVMNGILSVVWSLAPYIAYFISKRKFCFVHKKFL